MKFFFTLLLIGVLVSPLYTAKSSALYRDDGHQHVPVPLKEKERTMLQENFLRVLGVPEVPKSNHTHDKRAAAPKFLLDVYQTLLDEQQHISSRQTEFEMSRADIHAMHESDVVMSFTTQNPPRIILRHQKDQRLWFNVSQVPDGETIMAAELRIFKRNTQIKNKKKINYSIVLSKLVSQGEGEGLVRISEVPFNSQDDGWILFNVTQPLYDWVQNDESNLGLYINIIRQNSSKHVKPEVAGIELRGAEKQPFVVAFFKANLDLTSSSPVNFPALEFENELEHEGSSHRRSRRDTSKSKNQGYPFDHQVFKGTAPLSDSKSETSCQLRNMFVSFRDLGWHEWIIAPDGYSSHYCSGTCYFPLTSSMNATNHAIVQTLVHLLEPKATPTPCCAPTKSTEISVLYYVDASANVFLKRFKNMVVRACGCQ